MSTHRDTLVALSRLKSGETELTSEQYVELLEAVEQAVQGAAARAERLRSGGHRRSGTTTSARRPSRGWPMRSPPTGAAAPRRRSPSSSCSDREVLHELHQALLNRARARAHASEPRSCWSARGSTTALERRPASVASGRLEQAAERRAGVGGEVEQRPGDDAEDDRRGGEHRGDQHDLGVGQLVGLRRAAGDRGDATDTATAAPAPGSTADGPIEATAPAGDIQIAATTRR